MNDPRLLANTLNLHLSYQREVQDLVANGYYFLFSSRVNGVLVTSLKHRKNGRKLTATLYRHYWNIRENGKIIKEVKLPA